MLIWIVFALMTAALIGAVLFPFTRREASHTDDADRALTSVYTAQLAEIDADVARGVVDADEAAQIRAEIGRRLLEQAETKPSGGDRSGANTVSRGLPIAIVALVPLIAVGTYLSVGSPLLPSQPHASRVHQDANGVRIAELVRRVEARLMKEPEDGKGWDVIAPVYMRSGRYADAANAWRNAGRLLGETPERVLGYGEALVFAENGIVSEEARRALQRGVELRPDYLPAHYWLAIAKRQDGQLEAARDALTDLAKKVDPATPLGRTIADHLKDIDSQLGGGAVASGAAATSSEDTQAMIEGMVSGLAARLEDDGNDFEGWRRLIRSYVVLKRPDEARAALKKARRLFDGQKPRLDQLDLLARDLKLET